MPFGFDRIAEQALPADGAIACFGSNLISFIGPSIARRR
jgi:hypothetical protein